MVVLVVVEGQGDAVLEAHGEQVVGAGQSIGRGHSAQRGHGAGGALLG